MDEHDDPPKPKGPCRRYVAVDPNMTDDEIELELMRAEEVEQAMAELAAEREVPQI